MNNTRYTKGDAVILNPSYINALTNICPTASLKDGRPYVITDIMFDTSPKREALFVCTPVSHNVDSAAQILNQQISLGRKTSRSVLLKCTHIDQWSALLINRSIIVPAAEIKDYAYHFDGTCMNFRTPTKEEYLRFRMANGQGLDLDVIETLVRKLPNMKALYHETWASLKDFNWLDNDHYNNKWIDPFYKSAGLAVNYDDYTIDALTDKYLHGPSVKYNNKSYIDRYKKENNNYDNR